MKRQTEMLQSKELFNTAASASIINSIKAFKDEAKAKEVTLRKMKRNRHNKTRELFPERKPTKPIDFIIAQEQLPDYIKDTVVTNIDSLQM